MKESPHRQMVSAVNDGWVAGGSLFGSLMSGFLLGFFADRWLDTEPLLVIVGVLIGAYSGYMRLWAHAKEAERRHGR